MSISADSVLRLQPRGRVVRCVLAVAVVALATLLRFAVDPLIHAQIPYFIYIASVVVATALSGVVGGVIATAVSAFAGNYFFVEPRYEFIPHAEDWISMSMFSAVALGLVWFVGRWRQTEATVRELYAQRTVVLEQLPVGVMVADASGNLLFGNKAIERLFGRPVTESSTIAGYRGEQEYQPFRPDGRPMELDEAPIARALKGEVVADEELHVTRRDGGQRIISVSAAPIRREDGQIAGAVVAVVDVTERRRIEEELLRRQAELGAATLAAEVGVWTWTPATNRVSVGANWRGLFGVAPDSEVTFDTWAGALHPDDRQRAIDTLNAAWRDHQDFSTEYRVVRSDGTERWIIDRGRAFRDTQGNVVGMAGVNVDITNRKAAEDALLDANRLKDDFLATLSHELRTPLNAIVGWSDMLRRGDLPPDHARRAVESIYRNAKVQNELINDVLDVSRIISGKVRVERQPVDPVFVLQDALESVRSAADAKGISLGGDFGAIPFPIAADPTRLQQVFWNLLSNAVKFTPSGGSVRASASLVDGHLRVQVADTGMGIAPDFLPFVFDRFRQRDSSMTRTHAGLGLGLAIVRHLVELHGGTVKAASAGEGHGATFTVTLPARPFQERRSGGETVVPRDVPVPAIDPLPDDVPSLCGVRVLVVDDENDAREVAASVLRHHGANVAVAANADEVLDRFDEFNPHVLLVDLAMPRIDGYTLLSTIRTSFGQMGAKVPAIALTAYAREEDEQRALASGFQRHLPKPVDSHVLVRTVAQVRPASTGN